MPVKEKSKESETLDSVGNDIKAFKKIQNQFLEDLNSIFNTLEVLETPEIAVRLLETAAECLELLNLNTIFYRNLFNKRVDEYRQMKASRIETAST